MTPSATKKDPLFRGFHGDNLPASLSLKPLATTTPERRCLLLPREVVLLGCGNSGNGGKRRGGVFLFLFPSATVSRLTVSRQPTVNPEERVRVWTDGPPPGGSTQKVEETYIRQ